MVYRTAGESSDATAETRFDRKALHEGEVPGVGLGRTEPEAATPGGRASVRRPPNNHQTTEEHTRAAPRATPRARAAEPGTEDAPYVNRRPQAPPRASGRAHARTREPRPRARWRFPEPYQRQRVLRSGELASRDVCESVGTVSVVLPEVTACFEQ